MTQATKIRRAYFGLFVLTMFGTLLLLIGYLTRDPINRTNFARIAPGMSETEVLQLLGPSRNALPGGNVRAVPMVRVWVGAQGACLVFFDAEGKVLRGEYYNQPPRDPLKEAMRHVAKQLP